MHKKIWIAAGVLAAAIMLYSFSGCAKSTPEILYNGETQETENGADSEEGSENARDSFDGSKKDSRQGSETENNSETSESTVNKFTGNDNVENEEAAADIYVYVCGAVNKPGVYQLKGGDRIYKAIDAAGGLTEEADAAGVNQAELLEDGEQITVPTRQETEEGKETFTQKESSIQDHIVNINTADEAELTTLPGIGSTRALAIIEYRTANGAFTAIEDLKEIDGIGDKTFDKLKALITVDG